MREEKLMSGYEEIVKELELQFRKTSRRIIQLESEEETLHYLVDSFIQHIACDFVGIILKNNIQYETRIWGGMHDELVQSFPLNVADCSELLMVTSLYKNEYATKETCALHRIMDQADMKMWFTVPLVHEENHYGFCLIGFKRSMALLNMEHVFNEFGKDVASSIKVIREKKQFRAVFDGLTWITNQLSPNSSISNMVRKLTERAASTTKSDFAAIYLYNESNETYDLQASMFGDAQIPTKIQMKENTNMLSRFEQTGGYELSVPIQLGNEMYGLLYLARQKSPYTYDQSVLNLAQLIGQHFAMLIQHALHMKNEREQKERLKKLLQYQQLLVKETIVQDDFEGITNMIYEIYDRPVIMFDRFLRVLSVHGIEEGALLSHFVKEMKQHIFAKTVFQLYLKEEQVFSIWPIYGGMRDRIGYLAIGVNEQLFDEFDHLTIEAVSNISSIQFIKKKLVFDANEQMKDTFFAKLLTYPVDKEKIIQYASILNWDIYEPHRIAHIILQLEHEEEADLLTIQTEKMYIWEQINIDLLSDFPNMLMSAFNEQFIMIVPNVYEENNSNFWNQLHNKIEKIVSKFEKKVYFGIGIGKVVQNIEEYHTSYQQALESANVLQSRFPDNPYIFFEQLGSYMILHHLDDEMSSLFVHEQLKNLIQYEKEKNIDLWQTLKVYLLNYGNVKATAEQLFLHRSTLIYRLQKVEELIERDLNDADVCFDLMMAIKLMEMKGNVPRKSDM